MKTVAIYLFILFISICITMPTYSQYNKAETEVKALLNQQAQDWNKGKLEAFMQGYWKSEKLQFIGLRGVTYGWQQTLNNYKKAYPDKKTMGELTFELIEVVQQSSKLVSVTGKFILQRENMDDISGHFLLLVKKMKGKWFIIADHTS